MFACQQKQNFAVHVGLGIVQQSVSSVASPLPRLMQNSVIPAVGATMLLSVSSVVGHGLKCQQSYAMIAAGQVRLTNALSAGTQPNSL